jgi:putative ABC transport system permease protein
VRPKQVEAHAVEGEYFTIKKYDLTSGRVISPEEYELGTPVAVIGDEVAKYFFPNLNPLGRELRIGGIPYSVIGVIEHQGTLFGLSLDKLVVAPFGSQMHRLTNPLNDIGGMLVQAPSAVMLDYAMETVREALREHRHMHPARPDNFVMETSASALQFFDKIKKTMTIVGTALPAIGLIVGGMVIMNIMLVSVSERTHEIGIRKSIGARRRDILSQFLIEAATLSTVGAIIGIVLGISAAKIIAWQTPLPAAVAPWSIVAATLLGTVVGIVSGVYPARRASRLDPIEALRQE